jgi:hypothetical protein
MPNASAKLLDLLAINGRRAISPISGTAHRLFPAAPLPAPVRIFPRFVERRRRNKRRLCLKRRGSHADRYPLPSRFS